MLDFGGQYAHLIASRLRRLGAYTEILHPEDVSSSTINGHFAGLVYSGGPSSVYDADAPRCDPAILELDLPILGICYGHQLIMQQLGGHVHHSSTREYGPARLVLQEAAGIFGNENPAEQAVVWMSHGDEVDRLPPDFAVLASTSDCRYAAVHSSSRSITGLQFHPEVRHSERGDAYLRNFIEACGVAGSWNLAEFMAAEVEFIREQIQGNKVFLLCSGGVDSTVAFALLAKALPADHLRGLLIDTGFMRQAEASAVCAALSAAGIELSVMNAGERYFAALQNVVDPEQKRAIIGQLFVDVQADALKDMGLNPAEWFLGQGTIYPDTIESGATRHSTKIKTHHNRVPAIEALIAQGRVIEPLRQLYKDEVRDLGRLLGLPPELVDRHPFPGPGLAVRCLCTAAVAETQPAKEPPVIDDRTQAAIAGFGYESSVLPIRSVGVQGDSRSYAQAMALLGRSLTDLDWDQVLDLARLIPNQIPAINRVVLHLNPAQNDGRLHDELLPGLDLNPARIALLQKADRIVHDFQVSHGLYSLIWQFPVVLVPVGDPHEPQRESVILRPVSSSDAMTASPFQMDKSLLQQLTDQLMRECRLANVFYDLTSKPPGTIEWE
ncbi:MAG: glutamine-hydrolyzing GMP synthase [Leptospiraceae bacterium]|nr:glutamine-hydrolyzing GMP synthase [Leptospiraceae bacterium]